MATIGRSRAVAKVGDFEFSGFMAWMAGAAHPAFVQGVVLLKAGQQHAVGPVVQADEDKGGKGEGELEQEHRGCVKRET